MNNRNWLLVVAAATMTSTMAYADVIITPMVGYTLGGEVEDSNGNEYDLKGSESYGLSIEVPVENGQIGLFYSYQDNELESLDYDSSIQYLMIQSRLNMPINNDALGYLGVGLGGSYTDVDWADNKYGFAASIYAGLEYKFTDNIAVTGQIRWLGTIVDNDSQSACYANQSSSNCYIKFESDWMNQFQSNVGMVFRF
ncbi:outer membrane beta-barrel protein [Vibrio sp. CK2-1]|uniref:outer membrane beta-barrel protein n=1 Tax=Vibrio sp. CK2-1 TaxID=2912249 RepID=UPI001F300E48|nr:outer membrane beta-barrel protein [Vibrio sp. CK2-1]MCF7353142.1 outer membrane beta-barrel protein [Vibrio sp. CK2-1]